MQEKVVRNNVVINKNDKKLYFIIFFFYILPPYEGKEKSIFQITPSNVRSFWKNWIPINSKPTSRPALLQNLKMFSYW